MAGAENAAVKPDERSPLHLIPESFHTGEIMKKNNGLLILILAVGVFGILNTEMGVIGILPLVATMFGVSITRAALLVSGFALVIALSAPVLPLLFSGFDRKKVMLLSLAVFVVSNIISVFATDFDIILAARLIPAAFHPVYVSLAFTVAAESVEKTEAPKAVARVFIGVSAGLVLGVPMTSLIATESSFAFAMTFFAVVNMAVLAATAIWMPAMPVREKQGYGTQLRVLGKPGLWIAIIISILLNGSVFGFFSYMADYLNVVTGMGARTISLMLLVFGLANIAGNIVAGKTLSTHPDRTVVAAPFILSALFLLMSVTGNWGHATAALILPFGILAGIVANANQYLISNSATEAPMFANGLYLTAQNLGITAGSALCGFFISVWGTRYTLAGSILMLLPAILFIFIRLFVARKRYDTRSFSDKQECCQ